MVFLKRKPLSVFFFETIDMDVSHVCDCDPYKVQNWHSSKLSSSSKVKLVNSSDMCTLVYRIMRCILIIGETQRFMLQRMPVRTGAHQRQQNIVSQPVVI
jgi:hypothetical protein